MIKQIDQADSISQEIYAIRPPRDGADYDDWHIVQAVQGPRSGQGVHRYQVVGKIKEYPYQVTYHEDVAQRLGARKAVKIKKHMRRVAQMFKENMRRVVVGKKPSTMRWTMWRLKRLGVRVGWQEDHGDDTQEPSWQISLRLAVPDNTKTGFLSVGTSLGPLVSVACYLNRNVCEDLQQLVRAASRPLGHLPMQKKPGLVPQG
ncbi:MAG: hypothetical protein IPI58_08205 [Alphaproteobacteria bacterium]|nr:MAG: hypothetical protein IPI58_08205 [Alphaproteobacteria bacterium]